jgi:hypothetical protein
MGNARKTLILKTSLSNLAFTSNAKHSIASPQIDDIVQITVWFQESGSRGTLSQVSVHGRFRICYFVEFSSLLDVLNRCVTRLPSSNESLSALWCQVKGFWFEMEYTGRYSIGMSLDASLVMRPCPSLPFAILEFMRSEKARAPVTRGT